jgi:hypothetical protein
VLERCPQTAVVIVLDRDEAERLQDTSCCLAQRAKDLSHAVHRARLRLKCEFDECAIVQPTRQLQQSAGG